MSTVNTKQQSGNAVIIVLVALIIAAVGALAFMSGKIGNKTAEVTQAVETAVQAAGVQPSAEDPMAGQPDVVVAKVDGFEIKRSEAITLMNMMPPQLQQMPPEQRFMIAVEQLVNNQIVDQQSKGTDLSSDPDVVKQLADAKEQIIRAKFVEKAVLKEISKERLQKKYDEYVKNFPNEQEVRASHILVDSEDKAKDIIKKLNDGKAFADMAKENSKDGTAQNGGDLGYFTKQDVVAPFAEVAFSTKVGEYTKKPVKTDFGFHVIKVEDQRKRMPAKYEEIKGFLEQEERRAVLEELFKKWRDTAKVERFDIEGKPLPAAPQQEPAAGAPPPVSEPAAEKAAEPEKKPE